MSLSNTPVRIISAIIMILIVFGIVAWGAIPSLCLVMLVGILTADEIFNKFLKKNRKSSAYLASLITFLIPFVLIGFLYPNQVTMNFIVNLSMLMNVVLIVYLFYVDMDYDIFSKWNNWLVYSCGLFALLPFVSLSSIFFLDNWRSLFAILLFITYGMDSGAWLIGKNFGKHKLWPSVSPNKTVEGLIGGAITSGILAGAFWHISFGEMSVQLFVFFMFLGVISQVGDLVQSKMKRQAGIKDSSSLIPGHGGVYDRIDSLIFLSPFYVTVVKYYYLN
jgi:phosphatidate cytidylyltransferase